MKTEFKQGGVSFSFVVTSSALREDEDHVAQVLKKRSKGPEGLALVCRDNIVPGGHGLHLNRPRKNRYTRRSLINKRSKPGGRAGAVR